MDELHYLELLELTRRLHARALSPVEAAQAQLDRIAALDGTLNAYALVTAEAALDQARQAEAEIARGEIRGPLHGAPIAVKDLCWTQGVPTAAGTVVYGDFVPDEDATVVRRLRDAGAVILGKLRLTEGAYTDHHPELKRPVNPWGEAYWVGSSSSGSGVGTAAGLCYGSLGSDTGGSIRFPSAANGLSGIKGTWGRVSRHGVFALAPTLDHVGPMCRSAADAAAMLGAIAGADPADPTAARVPVPDYLAGIDAGIAGLRVGLDEAWIGGGADADTARVMAEAQRAVQELGAELVPVRFPDPGQVVLDWFPLCGVEVAVAHEATYPSRAAEYGASLAELIELGRGVSGLDYQKIVLRRGDFSGRVGALFEGIDLLLVPVTSFAAPTLELMGRLGGNDALLKGLLQFTSPFDMSGNPTITLPGGFTGSGQPIGFQFVAPHWREELLARAGVAYQGVTDWHRRHPVP